MKNADVKKYLLTKFGDQIRFCTLTDQSKPKFFFHASITVEDLAPSHFHAKYSCKIFTQNGKKLRDIIILLKVDFGMENKFCDRN